MGKLRNGITALLMGAALVGAPAVAATSAAAAPPSSCTFTLVSLDQVSLQHDNGKDFVFLQVGETWGPSGGRGAEYTETVVGHGPGSFGSAASEGFVGDIDVRLVIDEFPINRTVGTITIPCVPVTNAEQVITNNDAIYILTYNVVANP
jgi:hypothetical protein